MMSNQPTPSSQLIDIVRLRDQLNDLSRALLPSRAPAFGPVSLTVPDVSSTPELAFIRTASWLYSHYFETGRVSVRFLIRWNATSPGDGHGDEHLDVVHALRTWSQHNIDQTSQRDAKIAITCETWFEQKCGTRTPRSKKHWAALLQALLDDAKMFLIRLLSRLEAIEQDPDRDLVFQQWMDRLNRDWPAHRYHGLILEVAADIGRLALDPKAFYDRYGSVIRKGAELLTVDSNLEVEVRKLVERALLTETAPVLPITGADIMKYFEIPPGPEVGHLLKRAQRLCDEQPSDRDGLLARLLLDRQVALDSDH